MRTQEIELLDQIICLNTMKSDRRSFDWEKILLQEKTVSQAFEALQAEKIGLVSSDFIRHPMVKAFIGQQYGNRVLQFWYFIQTENLVVIEEKIKALTAEYHKDLQQYGCGIPPGARQSRLSK